MNSFLSKCSCVNVLCARGAYFASSGNFRFPHLHENNYVLKPISIFLVVISHYKLDQGVETYRYSLSTCRSCIDVITFFNCKSGL